MKEMMPNKLSGALIGLGGIGQNNFGAASIGVTCSCASNWHGVNLWQY